MGPHLPPFIAESIRSDLSLLIYVFRILINLEPEILIETGLIPSPNYFQSHGAANITCDPAAIYYIIICLFVCYYINTELDGESNVLLCCPLNCAMLCSVALCGVPFPPGSLLTC